MMGHVNPTTSARQVPQVAIRWPLNSSSCSSTQALGLKFMKHRTKNQHVRKTLQAQGSISSSARGFRRKLLWYSLHLAGCSARWVEKRRAAGLRPAALMEDEEDRRLQQVFSDINDHGWLAMLLILSDLGIFSGTAIAEEVAYRGDAGNDFLKNVAGIAYIVIVVVFVIRLFKKRATTATSQRLARKASEAEEEPEPEVEAQTSPLRAAWGALQAGACAFLLFKIAGSIDGFFDGQELPAQYTARNITITIRTITSGLVYLLTFIFAANTAGLVGFTLQLLLFPEEPKPKAGIRTAEDAKDGTPTSNQ